MKKNKKILVSQSTYRDFHAVDHYTKQPTFCKERFRIQYMNKKRTPPSLSMLKGLYFEQHLIGASRGGEIYHIPKQKSGKPSKVQLDLDKLIIKAKKVMKDMKIKSLEVQPEWKDKWLSSHPDLLATWPGAVTEDNPDGTCIIDIKYTDTKATDRFGPFTYGDLDNKSYEQVPQYVFHHYLRTGNIVPFYYLVFAGSGWIKWFQVHIEEDQLAQYAAATREFYEETVPNFDFSKVVARDYIQCAACPFFTKGEGEKPENRWKPCKKRLKVPQLIEVVYER